MVLVINIKAIWILKDKPHYHKLLKFVLGDTSRLIKGVTLDRPVSHKYNVITIIPPLYALNISRLLVFNVGKAIV